MPHSFVVYIDESGDEGFQFEKGSSQWFVLSAAIIEKSIDLETVKLVDTVRTALGRKDKEPLHFRKLKHEHRIPFLHQIVQSRLKTVSVFIYKPVIRNVEIFQQRNRLYFYAARLLLERVSWYCRDHKTTHTLGDGSAEIIFSNRGGMKYEELRSYLEILKSQTGPFDVQIDWSIIKTDQITAHSAKTMGLQIADAVASGFFFGLQMNQYGFAEDRYGRMLKSVVYSNKGRFNGYGLKIWPGEGETLIKNESHLVWLKEFCEI
ncbi:MAG: DUF3800 domain-containing protein [Chitinophagaceae bacterium]|nr:DUF3800 domain-containing protein [Anaerolineae bacterium]